MSKIYTVSNADELKSALSSAKGGDRIELSGGDYGKLELWDGRLDYIKYDAPVTIVSADPSAPASFSRVELHGAKNITFDNVVFDYQYSDGDAVRAKPFEITNSSDIVIKNSQFDGDLVQGSNTPDDGFGAAFGLTVRDSTGITVENNEFFNWHRAAVFGQSGDIVVSGNEVYEVSSDGFDFAAVTNVLIESNHFHDFRKSDGSTAHMDMIQFWTAGTETPSTDIIIRGNLLDTGDGDSTQSIFMRNERVDSYGDGLEMFYKNMLIEENTIYNGHIHGITVGETDGLVIRNNTLVEAEGGQPLSAGNVSIPSINVASSSMSVEIVQNAVFSIAGHENQPDWVLKNNAFIQNNDPDLPGHYDEVFISSSLDATSGQHNYIAKPGAMIDRLDAGSTLTEYVETPDDLQAQFNVFTDIEEGHVFDASLSSGPNGRLSLQDAVYTWDFGDGSSAQGAVIKHVYSEPGNYNVSLTVALPDGTSVSEKLEIGLKGGNAVNFDTESGGFQTAAYGAVSNANADIDNLVGENGSFAIGMSGSGVQATIEHEEFSELFGADNFDLSLTLRALNGNNSGGEVFRVHGHFQGLVNNDGSLTFIMGADDGSKVKLTTEGVNLVDGQNHDLRIVFDGDLDTVEVWIDGNVNKVGEITGNLTNSPRDLTFGDPWGKKAFDGEVSEFSLTSASRDYPTYEGDFTPVSSTESTLSAGGASSFFETDTTVAEPPEEPIVEPKLEEPGTDEESNLQIPVINGGYVLDLASADAAEKITLHDSALIAETETGPALSFDGEKDFVSLGRLTEFETSQKVAFSIDFMSENMDGGTERLVWNHMKFGLSIEGDGLRIQAHNNDDKYHRGFEIDGLGLTDGNRHNATVMVDADADRLQVVVDDVLVLDEQGTDFDFVGAGGHEWGWSLGTGWNRWFEGEVYEFQVSDDFEFLDQAQVDEGFI